MSLDEWKLENITIWWVHDKLLILLKMQNSKTEKDSILSKSKILSDRKKTNAS